MIIDVHTHIDLEEYFKDLPEVLERAENVGVKAIICNGLDPKSNRRILSLSDKYDLIKPALGFYPCEVDKVSEEELNKEIEFIRNNKDKIVAIGEVGLDKKHDNDFEKQKIAFRKFITLAKELDIPIIIHSRFAEEIVIDILEEEDAKKVLMHCFSGKKKLVERCVKNKYYFSIPCNVVRSQQFQDMVDIIPLNRILTETDAPFLTHDASIKRNEPMYITESLKKIAEIKGVDVKEIETIVYSNYQRLF